MLQDFIFHKRQMPPQLDQFKTYWAEYNHKEPTILDYKVFNLKPETLSTRFVYFLRNNKELFDTLSFGSFSQCIAPWQLSLAIMFLYPNSVCCVKGLLLLCLIPSLWPSHLFSTGLWSWIPAAKSTLSQEKSSKRFFYTSLERTTL